MHFRPIPVIALALAGLALAGCGARPMFSGEATASEEALAVVGASMEPTLHCARPGRGCAGRQPDRVVVRDERQVERREIVAFAVGATARRRCGGGGMFVKRVVALAGERVSFRSGAVYVGGRRLREPYANGPTEPGPAGTDVYVPGQHVFVLGDNRDQSCDSRVWGPLSVRRIVGVGVAIERGSRIIPLP